MYKLCRTEQSAVRQRQLEEGLLQAMSVCHYDEITISDLCQQMQIPRKSFYRYFSGKDGALHALIDHTLIGFEAGSLHKLMARESEIRDDLEKFFSFWKTQKPLLDALARSGLSGILVQRAMDTSLAEAGYRRTSATVPLLEEKELTIMFMICGLMTMMVHWHHSGFAVPESRMAAVAASVLTKPLWSVK